MFLLGGYLGRNDYFPFRTLHAIRTTLFPKEPPQSRYIFNSAGRLVADEQKISVGCPQQTTRTAMLLVVGQSNAANHHGQRFSSRHSGRLINFFNGHCFVAASPLLGSTGSQGEYWTELGNLLLETGEFDLVVLAPAAVTGSAVADWAVGGSHHIALIETIDQLRKAGYTPSQLLWHQGERDYVDGTSEAAYRASFLSLVQSIRTSGVDAPVFVSVASKCLEASNGGSRTHQVNNPVTRAQKALPDQSLNIFPGIDTDLLLNDHDRYDDCHIGWSGQLKIAQAWTKLLTAEEVTTSTAPFNQKRGQAPSVVVDAHQ